MTNEAADRLLPDVPRTPRGVALFSDNEPMDMDEADGVTHEDIIIVEVEAAYDERKATVERIRAALHAEFDDRDERIVEDVDAILDAEAAR